MADTDAYSKPSPKLSANFISRLFLWWLKDLFWYGRKHDIGTMDLYEVLPHYQSKLLCNDFEKIWNTELQNAKVNNRKPSLWSAIIKTYRLLFFKNAMFPVSYVLTSLLIPLILEQLLLNIDSYLKYIYTTALLSLQIVQMIGLRYGFIKLHLVGMRARIALTSLLYRKITRLTSSSANDNAHGTVTNLISNDVHNFEYTCFLLPFAVLAPIELLVTTYILWHYIGYVTFVTIALLIFHIFLPQALFYRLTFKLRLKQTVRTDQRISLIEEVINGIQTIKMFVWETFFKKLVCVYRRREIQVFRKMLLIPAVTNAISVFGPRLTVFITILVYILLYGTISPITILIITQYMMNLRQSMAIYFADTMKFSALINVSMSRIEKFLLLDEIKFNVKGTKSTDAVSIVLEKVMISKKSQYCNINFSNNKLYFIVGSVGAGKTTLLNVILGEIQLQSGEVFVSGKISYASQVPWLFAASIRENIIFGEEYEEEKYKTVTKACALIEDFSQLPYGDKTLVGERGLNLSGGQRTRINLARAVYRTADIYLLDDPLSAVDAHVAKTIFVDCINGYLKNKIRILVTNNIQYLQLADEIVLLDNGIIEFKGTPLDFQKKVKNSNYYLAASIEMEKLASNEGSNGIDVSVESHKLRNKIDNKPQELEELVAKGSIQKYVYWRFIRAGASYFMMIFVIFGFLVGLLSISAFDYWQIAWTKNEVKSFITILGQNPYLLLSYTEMSLFICGGLIVVIIITTLLKNLLFFKIIMNACEKLHNSMFESLIKTSLKFFQDNTSGLILNRFTKDTGTVDNMLATTMYEVLDILAICIAIFPPVLIVNIWNALPALITIYICYKFSKFYTPTAQDIKRLECNAKSPVLSYIATSLSGLSTIRSSESQNRVSQIFDIHQDHHTAVHYLTLVTSLGFSLWLEIVMFILWVVVAYGSIIFFNNSFVGDIGLALVQLRSIASMIQYAVRQVVENIIQMTSVERMLQFVDLESEPGTEVDLPKDLNENWPNRGEVQFDRVFLRYSDDAEPILKNLSFRIEPGIKVGIVGRTGAGKSSLIAALFRLAKIDGSLLIDGIDIKTINVFHLRSHITIIPQESILFASSLRDNLDPQREFSDSSLWSALENVELNKMFESLDCRIDQGGSNLSAGQRQLLCLARAIIKKNKILVMDEATANIDPATDEIIQKTIKLVFKDCTVLTIAHRINTIIDNDKVLVMDNGEVVEFDHPYNLLQQKDGFFYKLVQRTGSATFQRLQMIAEQKYRKQPDIGVDQTDGE